MLGRWREIGSRNQDNQTATNRTVAGESHRRNGGIWLELSCECWESAGGSGDTDSRADTDGWFKLGRRGGCRADLCARGLPLLTLPFALTVNSYGKR